MFKINPHNTFTEKIRVMTPGSNGVVTQGAFMAEFEIVSQDEFDEMIEDQWTNSEVLDRVLKRVWEVGDVEGNELPADKALDAVKNDTLAVSAATSKYLERIQGKKGQRNRTSRRQRATG